MLDIPSLHMRDKLLHEGDSVGRGWRNKNKRKVYWFCKSSNGMCKYRESSDSQAYFQNTSILMTATYKYFTVFIWYGCL